jgi:nucleoside-diphosphate-sugar epimerase
LERETCADRTAINLGTMERITVLDGAKMVCDFTKHKAEIKKRPDMPTGPLNRVADKALAKRLLGWEPKVAFLEGGKRTIVCYDSTKDRGAGERTFRRLLTER